MAKKVKKKETKLKRFQVFGTYTQSFTAEVEAKDEDDTISAAQQLDYDDWEEDDNYIGEIEVIETAKEIDEDE